LKSLNPAHLKALLGQEVVMTLSDHTTRQGVVYSLDPESFTVVLATGTLRPEALGGPSADECVVIPGHAVRAVEVMGGNALALDALRGTSSPGWLLTGAKHGFSAHAQGGAEGDDGRFKAMKAAMGSRQNSWGANSTYGGMAALLKPKACEQLECVKRCLNENMVPFIERASDQGAGDVELVVLGSLVVRYPYTADSCACANEIVLARVRELIAAGSPNGSAA
jgi:hypothetical protein